MNRRILLGLALLLVCGLGLTIWFLTSEGGAAPAVTREPVQRDARAARPPGAIGTAELTEPARLAEQAPDDTSDEAPASARAAVTHTTEATYEVLVQDQHGAPIAGAEVRRTVHFGVPGDEAERRNLGEPVLTDERGRCTFSAPGDAALFHVRAEGFCHSSQGTRTLTVVLGPAVRVSGRVLEAGTLLPVPGAELHPLRGECKLCEPRATTTDALGNYSMAGFPLDERVGLETRAPGFLLEKTPFKLGDLVASSIDVTLQRGAEVWLEFFDVETGTPLEKVHVRGARKQRSDAQGRVRVVDFVAADESDMRLEVKLKGYAEARVFLEPRHLNAAEPLRVPMVRLRTLSGHVNDTAGAPVHEASVRATDTSEEDAEEQWRRTYSAAFDQGPRRLRFKVRSWILGRTNPDGTFELPRLAPWIREVEFDISHRAYVEATGSRRIDEEADTRWSEWTLVPAASGSGKIRGQLTLNGVPTAGRVMWAGALRSGGEVADEAGAFLLESVELGSVHITAVSEGFKLGAPGCTASPTGSWTATVEAGQTSTLDLDLAVAVASISGHVRYADGEPVQNARVNLATMDDCALLTTHADADGFWSVQVPTRISSWVVFTQSGSETVARDDVGPGASGVELVIERYGTLLLRVLDGQTGRPVTRFELRWQRPGAREHFQLRKPSHYGLPDASGWYEIDLLEGPLDLAISTREQDSHAQPAFAFGIDVRRGQSLELVVRAGHRLDMKLRKGQAPWPRDVEIYLLAEHERRALRWNADRDKVRDGDLSTGHPARTSRRVKFSGRRARLTGLPPGRYRFVSFPDTVTVYPATVRAGPGSETVQLRWERP